MLLSITSAAGVSEMSRRHFN
jgi:hypothetical protein